MAYISSIGYSDGGGVGVSNLPGSHRIGGRGYEDSFAFFVTPQTGKRIEFIHEMDVDGKQYSLSFPVDCSTIRAMPIPSTSTPAWIPKMPEAAMYSFGSNKQPNQTEKH